MMPTKPGVPNLPTKPVPPIAVIPPDGGPNNKPTDLSLVVSVREQNIVGQELYPCQGDFELSGGDSPRLASELYGCMGVSESRDKNALPLSAGRDNLPESSWNVWMDGMTSDSRDTRHDRDVNGYNQTVAVGVDRLISKDVIAGASINVARSGSSGFNDSWNVDSTGYTIMPYVAYRFADEWVLTTMLGFGQTDIEEDILSLSSDYNTTQYSLSLSASSSYLWGDIVYRPTISMYVSQDQQDEHVLTGNILGALIAVEMEDAESHFGSASSTHEISRMFIMDNGNPVFPFLTLDISYDFDRPGDGEIYSDTLTLESVSPWRGSIEAGVRSVTQSGVQVEASWAYTSLAVSGLDQWQGRIFVSYGF
jgi:hypothetical protein